MWYFEIIQFIYFLPILISVSVSILATLQYLNKISPKAEVFAPLQ